MNQLICRICGNRIDNKEVLLKGTMYGTHGEYPYFICGKCGCLQIKEKPYNIESFYDTDHYYAFNMNKRKLKNELLFLQMKNQVFKMNLIGKVVGKLYPVNYTFYKRLNKNDALLDIGCGDGEMLHWLKRLGFQNVMGIDPFIRQDIRDNQELFVAKGDIREYKFNKKFKMITMIHALEHVYDQQEQIESMDKLLDKGGYLVFQLPVLSKYYWEKYGNNLYTLDPPRHFYLHTRKSLQELMKPYSYEMVSYETEIDVAIPEMARNIATDCTEKNEGTGFITGTICALKSGKLRKKLKKEEDGAIATVVFQKIK